MPPSQDLRNLYEPKYYKAYHIELMMDENLHFRPQAKVKLFIHSEHKELGSEVMLVDIPPGIVTALNNWIDQASAAYESRSGLTKKVR